MNAQLIRKYYDFFEKTNKRFNFIYGGASSGKCLEKGTKIVMYSGKLEKVENVKIDDLLMGIDSTPRKVLSLHSGIDDLYVVKQYKGLNYTINGKHILTLRKCDYTENDKGKLSKAGNFRVPRGRYPNFDKITNIPLSEYSTKSNSFKRNFLGYRTSIEFSKKKISIDPYFLGLFLGDGDKNRIAITTIDKEIKDYIYGYAKKLGMGISVYSKKGNFVKSYLVTNGNCRGKGKHRNPLLNLFKRYDLINNKHIPDSYLYNTKKIRLQILAGLLDTDGYRGKNGYEITQKSKKLAYQIYYLASSLGFRCSIKETTSTIKDINFEGIYYRVLINGETYNIPVKTKRKKVKKYKIKRNPHTTGLNVKYKGRGEYYGFTLNGDGLFLLEDFTVLHNSHSMGQYFIRKFFQEEKNKIFLVIRTTLPALRITAYKLIIDLANEYGFPVKVNKSEMLLTFKGNQMYFKSLLDSAGGIERIKSFNCNYIWAEELTEFTLAGFRRLNLILRAKTNTVNKLYGTFNPIDVYHWINTEYFEKRADDIATLHTTYEDNPFNTDAYMNELEALKDQDENYYNIYTKGLWGVRKNIIYEKWHTISFNEIPSIENCDEVFYGLDFGYNNPSGLVELRVKDDIIYEVELLYETHLTNTELIDKVKPLVYDKSLFLYCDSSEPDRIKDFRNAGFNAKPSRKGKHSVRDGIGTVKSKTIYITTNSVNLIKERRAYKYKEDATGIALEDPVKFNDHLLDAERMAIFTHMGKRGVKKGSIYYPGKPKKEPVKDEEKVKLIIPSTKGKIFF